MGSFLSELWEMKRGCSAWPPESRAGASICLLPLLTHSKSKVLSFWKMSCDVFNNRRHVLGLHCTTFAWVTEGISLFCKLSP